MALRFSSSSHYARLQNQTWLDAGGPLSFFVRFKFTVVDAKQYIFSYVGSDGQMSLRRDAGTTTMRFSVTDPDTHFRTKDGSTIVSAGTVYTCAGSWKVNDAAGMRIWEDLAERTPANSTTTQTTDFAPGTSTLWVALQSSSLNPGKCHIDQLLLIQGLELTQSIVNALYYGVPPNKIAAIAACDYSYYPCWSDSLTHIHDYGPNGRHFASGDITSAEAGDALGTIQSQRPLGDTGSAWRKPAVYFDSTKTLTGGLRISVDRVRNQLGGARVLLDHTATTTGGARVRVEDEETLTGGALLDFSTPLTVLGGARVTALGSLAYLGGGKLLLEDDATLTGGAAVRTPNVEATLTGGALTWRQFTRSLTGGSRTNTHRTAPTLTGGARLRKTASGVPISGGSLLKRVFLAQIPGGSRVSVSRSAQLLGGVGLATGTTRTLTGGARLRWYYGVNITGGALVRVRNDAQVTGGCATLRGNMSRTTRGGARIQRDTTVTLGGGGLVATAPTHTVAGGSRVEHSASVSLTGGCALTGVRGSTPLMLTAEFRKSISLTAEFRKSISLTAEFRKNVALTAEF